MNRQRVDREDVHGLPACPFCAATDLGLYEHTFAKEFAVICHICGAEGPARTDPNEAMRLWSERIVPSPLHTRGVKPN